MVIIEKMTPNGGNGNKARIKDVKILLGMCYTLDQFCESINSHFETSLVLWRIINGLKYSLIVQFSFVHLARVDLSDEFSQSLQIIPECCEGMRGSMALYRAERVDDKIDFFSKGRKELGEKLFQLYFF